MNKYIIGVIVILIAVVAIWWVAKKTSTPEPNQSEQEQQSTPEATETKTASVVTYTASGFSPSNLTIQRGDTVTFINQSNEPMWVASAIHPTHTLYPEFDTHGTIGKGESYSFTFERAGVHPYHNHVNPAKGGTITVNQ